MDKQSAYFTPAASPRPAMDKQSAYFTPAASPRPAMDKQSAYFTPAASPRPAMDKQSAYFTPAASPPAMDVRSAYFSPLSSPPPKHPAYFAAPFYPLTMAIPAVTMKAIAEKKTVRMNLYKPLKDHIITCLSNWAAWDMDSDLKILVKMRDSVQSGSLQSRHKLMQDYYKALCAMEFWFPIHQFSFSFTWYDAFKRNQKASDNSINLEKAAIIFNLGAVHSQIALSADPTSEKACSSFEAAAGAFAFLRDYISTDPIVGQSTMDISVECAGMLESFMLAQAQECIFEKAVSNGKSSSDCSKIAMQVSHYYQEACEALDCMPLKKHIDQAWSAHVHFKATLFYAEACYRFSLHLHEKQEIAEEIARLKDGLNFLTQALNSAAAELVEAPLAQMATRLKDNMNLKLKMATDEIDTIYHQRKRGIGSLPPLPTASFVQSTPMNQCLDARSVKLFSSFRKHGLLKLFFTAVEFVVRFLKRQNGIENPNDNQNPIDDMMLVLNYFGN